MAVKKTVFLEVERSWIISGRIISIIAEESRWSEIKDKTEIDNEIVGSLPLSKN